MATDETNSLIEQRKAKLAALRAKGIDPFKNKFTPTEKCAEARGNYVEGREVAVAGRITAHRDMGKSMFIDVRDQSGRIQVYAQKNVLGDEQFEIFRHFDLGDFIGARGTLFTTKTGEISIKLASFTILAKALRPPPEKWHGLADTEIRYRQRYLDLVANPDVKDVFLKRTQIICEIRNFLNERGYVEVETPMMQAIPGGAAAQPFKTFHNALGCEFYLRIALELYLKRLLVGGIDRVYEIGRNFRNEGLSRKHNPEFTMLEAYEAFGDYETMMELVESMIKRIAKALGNTDIEQNRSETVTQLLHKAILFVGGYNLDCARATPPLPQEFASLFAELTQFHLALRNGAPYYEIAAKAHTAIDAKLRQLTETNWVPAIPSYGDLLKQLHGVRGELSRESAQRVVHLGGPWRRVKYKDLVREKAGADWFELTREDRLGKAVHELGISFQSAAVTELIKSGSRALYSEQLSPSERAERLARFSSELERFQNLPEDFEVTGAVFEKLIEPTLIQPTFVTHLPKELVPLAKLSPDDPTTVEVFECCINGQEIAPAYTEQNDPIEQRERLEHQAGGEQQKLDEDFLVALEHGMPPAGGMGMGIDRLCMMLLGQESIRDVILFPQLKPK
jgi:lysyl-tRNA synthetase class 2